MLVLSRKAGEEIRIGGGITVTVVRIQGNRVRLGFDAPQHVAIIRSELADTAELPSICLEPAFSQPAYPATGQ